MKRYPAYKDSGIPWLGEIPEHWKIDRLKWSVVTVLKSVVPMIQDLCRKTGIMDNVASIRDIDTPVLELQDKKVMQSRLLMQIEKAINDDGAQGIVLGCTGMLGLAQDLQNEVSKKNVYIPVIDPTGYG